MTERIWREIIRSDFARAVFLSSSKSRITTERKRDEAERGGASDWWTGCWTGWRAGWWLAGGMKTETRVTCSAGCGLGGIAERQTDKALSYNVFGSRAWPVAGWNVRDQYVDALAFRYWVLPHTTWWIIMSRLPDALFFTPMHPKTANSFHLSCQTFPLSLKFAVSRPSTR